MKNNVLISAGIIALLCSCSRSLTDIGYSTSPINTTVHVNSASAPPIGQSRGYVTQPGDYYLYNFVSDVDMEYFYKSRVLIRAAIVQGLYAQMNAQDFKKKSFDKRYASLCSPEVLAAVKEWRGDSNLGGWQIFKPYPGLDATKMKYEIAYDGDDWFSITPAGDDSKVRLRVVLAGKKLQPVVVEVDNPAFGVNVVSSTKVGKGFDFGHGWIANGYGNYRRSEGYMSMLAGIIYDRCADKSRNIVTGDAILTFAKSMSQEQEQLLSGFYKDLVSYNSASLSKKYKKWLYADVEKAIAANHREANSALGKWKAFDVAETSNVVYEGNNWYRISGAADSTKDIHVQMVYCDRDMRPMIIGLYNKPLGIETGLHIDSDMSDSPGWPWVCP
ncbi:MAG: hypothetical protein IKG75_04560 [Bacteroidaceae bacterium]|nr:hypothetical protein [Bacteroidaceae bacterium]